MPGSPSSEDEDEDASSSSDGFNDPAPRSIPNMATEAKASAMEDGYDSDGGVPPPNNTAVEASMLEEEEALGEAPPAEEAEDTEEAEAPAAAAPNKPVPINDDDLNKLKVAEIKDQLRIRDVPFSSRLKRPALLERLKQSLHLPVVAVIDRKKKPSKKEGAKVDDMSEFAPGAYWRVLQADAVVVDEPNNPSFERPRAPTLPEEDVDKFQLPKHNFKERFDRPIFTGTTIADAGDEVQRTKGEPRLSFLEKHKLTSDSHPVEFLEAFMPATNPVKSATGTHFSLFDAVTWTNLKANLSHAGTADCYHDWIDFSLKELKQHLGLLMLNGLSPSPKIELMFDRDDEANFNPFAFANIGNAVRRHRMFRAFFAVQDPRKEVPPRKTSPMFKVLPIINWLNKVGKLSWQLGPDLSVDEQTIGFQGRHADKLRITYKAEGDGFQCDALCDSGFTYAHYFRNERPPAKYIKDGLSPLHARVMWLFDRLVEKHHRVYMDNLYISAKFAKAALNHPKKVLTAGVARKNGRGIPLSVIQEEVKNPAEAYKVRGTVKAAVLQGDKDCPDLVAVSVYDTKPVHFISTIVESIEWIVKGKKVWNEAAAEMKPLKFLRLNCNDDYNNKMNSVDLADQLRNNYRFDHWLRNFKWWWAVFLWWYGVMVVNAYVVYCSVMEEAKVPKRQRLTHYQFRLAIARIWIDRHGDETLRQWKLARMEVTTRNATPNVSDATRKRGRSPIPMPARATPSPTSNIATYGSARKVARTKSPQKAAQFTTNSLKFGGKLDCRLDYGKMRHIPITAEKAGKKDAKCQMHRWALERDDNSAEKRKACESRRGIIVCTDCHVSLCVDCYGVFHTEENLVANQEKIGAAILKEEKARKMTNEKKMKKFKKD